MRSTPLLLVAIAALLLAALPAQAHEHVCIQGSTATPLTEEGAKCDAGQDLEFIVGWRSEPAVTGEKNGLDLGVRVPSDQSMVENVTTLTAQYEYGGLVKQLSLEGQFGRPGWYTDYIIPTKEGTYTVRIGGTVNGRAVSFTVDPEAVGPANDLMFPVKEPTTGDLDERLTALETKVAQMKDTPGPGAQQGGVDVKPENKTPGFEPLLLVGALAAALVLVRRR